jgi:hypothetical protein
VPEYLVVVCLRLIGGRLVMCLWLLARSGIVGFDLSTTLRNRFLDRFEVDWFGGVVHSDAVPSFVGCHA